MMYLLISLAGLAMFALLVFAFLRMRAEQRNAGLGPGGRFPPGTRAFEAELTLSPLRATMGRMLAERASATDPALIAKLDRQLQFHADQEARLIAIVESRDVSPGKGYIGFEPAPE